MMSHSHKYLIETTVKNAFGGQPHQHALIHELSAEEEL